jgi:2-polyprenyl-6-hydroxyphenyl methylase/3-demethylubiquinone-9 3-methyltransferase
MDKKDNIYNQIDWWNEKNALLNQLPVKFNYFLSKIDDPKNLKVLDIGCGGGLLAEEFAKVGAKVTGIDSSKSSIKIAQKHAQKNNLDIKYLIGKAEKLPVKEKYDIVICADVFEHVENLEQCISEISRVLEPEGLLFYDTINKTLLSRISIVWINNIILKWQLNKIGVKKKSLPVHEWKNLVKPKKLFSLLDKYGIKNREVTGFNFAGFKNGNVQLKIGGTTRMAYIGYAING